MTFLCIMRLHIYDQIEVGSMKITFNFLELKNYKFLTPIVNFFSFSTPTSTAILIEIITITLKVNIFKFYDFCKTIQ